MHTTLTLFRGLRTKLWLPPLFHDHQILVIAYIPRDDSNDFKELPPIFRDVFFSMEGILIIIVQIKAIEIRIGADGEESLLV